MATLTGADDSDDNIILTYNIRAMNADIAKTRIKFRTVSKYPEKLGFIKTNVRVVNSVGLVNNYEIKVFLAKDALKELLQIENIKRLLDERGPHEIEKSINEAVENLDA